MQYAKLIKLGGELIAATEADYSDYKGFLVCPECGEPVFLRKAHKRGEAIIGDAFIHHKAIPEVSICEARVGRYDQQTVQAIQAQARGQRLAKLRVSLWKFIKSSAICDFRNWASAVREAKEYQMIEEVVQFADDSATQNLELLAKMMPIILDDIRDNANEVDILEPVATTRLVQFTKSRKRDWMLHSRIATEALGFLLTDGMKESRWRMLSYISNPLYYSMLNRYDWIDEDMATKHWRLNFAKHILCTMCLIFASIDWISWGLDGRQSK